MAESVPTTPAPPRDTEPIYKRPADYDLEHEGDDEDIGFYRRLVQRLRPRRVLELACGSGRVTLPLAGLAAAQGFEIVGVELAEEMLAAAAEKRNLAPPAVQRVLTLTHGDMRTWRTDELLLPDGEPLQIYNDQDRERVGFLEGTVWSLPSRVIRSTSSRARSTV